MSSTLEARGTAAVATWRDPWAWASLLAALALLLKCLGAPLGEAVAEDFDFLRRAVLERDLGLLDGGGSLAFWRPLAHQLYYAAFGGLILDHPRAVAAIHVVLLALAGLLLYRMLRRDWSGPVAFAAASFPLLAESSRTLVAWPSHFVDLGLYLFSVLALHEAGRGRRATALLSLLAALLCKEVAVVTALLLPWMPGVGRGDRRARARWVFACYVLLAAWAVAYLWVRHHAGLSLPHHIESDPAIRQTPPWARWIWAAVNSLRAVFSLAARPSRLDLVVLGAVAAFALLAVGLARARAGGPADRAGGVRDRDAWMLWGFAWFVLASASVAAIFPLWAPNRSQFGSLGLGIALVALLGAARPALALGLFALRLVILLASPGPPADVSGLPGDRGAFMDFGRLVRLQRFMQTTRQVLRARFPTLPHGARVGGLLLPNATEYALGGSHALQVWYRDTTLRWVSYDDFRATPVSRVATLVEFEPAGRPPVGLVDAAAMHAWILADSLEVAARFAEALSALDRADALQGGRVAPVFAGAVASRRAVAFAATGDSARAGSEARRAIALRPWDLATRFLAAVVEERIGRPVAALADLDTLLALAPAHHDAQVLRERLRRQLGRAPAR